MQVSAVGGQNVASKSDRRLEGERDGDHLSVRDRYPSAYQAQRCGEAVGIAATCKELTP